MMRDVKIPDELSEYQPMTREQLVACGIIPRKTVHRIKIFERPMSPFDPSVEDRVNEWLANKRPDQRVVCIRYDQGNVLIFYTEYEDTRVNYEDGEC